MPRASSSTSFNCRRAASPRRRTPSRSSTASATRAGTTASPTARGCSLRPSTRRSSPAGTGTRSPRWPPPAPVPTRACSKPLAGPPTRSSRATSPMTARSAAPRSTRCAPRPPRLSRTTGASPAASSPSPARPARWPTPSGHGRWSTCAWVTTASIRPAAETRCSSRRACSPTGFPPTVRRRRVRRCSRPRPSTSGASVRGSATAPPPTPSCAAPADVALASPLAHGAILEVATGLATAPRQVVVVGEADAEIADAARRVAADVVAVVSPAQAQAFAAAGFELFASKVARRRGGHGLRLPGVHLRVADDGPGPAGLRRASRSGRSRHPLTPTGAVRTSPAPPETLGATAPAPGRPRSSRGCPTRPARGSSRPATPPARGSASRK